MLTSFVVFRFRSRRNTSQSLSWSPEARLLARDSNATKRPSPEMLANSLRPLAWRPPAVSGCSVSSRRHRAAHGSGNRKQEVGSMGITEKITGRVKQAAGDLLGDEGIRRQGVDEERKADAKEELAREEERAARSE